MPLVIDRERHLVDLDHHAARELLEVIVEVVRAGQHVHRFRIFERSHHKLEPLYGASDGQVWQDGLTTELAASLLDECGDLPVLAVPIGLPDQAKSVGKRLEHVATC